MYTGIIKTIYVRVSLVVSYKGKTNLTLTLMIVAQRLQKDTWSSVIVIMVEWICHDQQ